MDFEISETTVTGRGGPIAIRDYVPATRSSRPAFLWVHGGGFTSGGLDQKESDAPARELAAGGRWVRTIDYRLAPRIGLWDKVDLGAKPNRFPAAHEDVLDVAADLRSASGAAISLGGASAGANVAAGVALAMRDAGGLDLRCLVLAYGVFHAVLPERPDVERDLRGPLAKWAFNPKMTRRMNLNYVGDDELLAPGYAFPGGADLQGLPPTLILNSRNDRLRASGDAFADELRAASVVVDQETVPTIHGFLNTPGKPHYALGVRRMRDWLASHA